MRIDKYDIDRFESKFTKQSKDECWEWNASLDNIGYGMFKLNNKTERAHRVSYYIYCGDIIKDMKVLHRCDNRCCVNPSHLFLGYQHDNIADMIAKGRQGFAKLTADQVLKIRAQLNSGVSQSNLAKIYGVDPSAISNIATRTTWRDI